MKDLMLDNVKRSCFSACPRKYYWEHVMFLRPIKGSTALRFGVAFHAGLDKYYSELKEKGWTYFNNNPIDTNLLSLTMSAADISWNSEFQDQEFFTDYKSLDLCKHLILNYVSYYAYDLTSLDIESVEIKFKHTIDADKGLYFTGRIDLLAFVDGCLYIFDHKTTGQPIHRVSNIASRSAQMLGYYYYVRNGLGKAPAGAMINYASVPSPYIRKDGSHADIKIEFSRIPAIYTSYDEGTWLEHFLWICDSIRTCESSGNWPMNFDSCYPFMGRCPYTELCEQHRKIDDVITDSFIVKEWNPLD